MHIIAKMLSSSVQSVFSFPKMCFQKYKIRGKKTIFGNLGAKLKTVSSHSLISAVGNLQLSVEKLQFPAPTFITDDAADSIYFL